MGGAVLFTASTYSHIRNFHLPYLAWFREKGWTVHVACGGEEEHIPHAHRTVPLPLEKKMTAPGNFRAAAELRRYIKETGFDLVITHTSLAAFFTRLAVMGLKDRPKVVNMAHGYLFDDDTSPLKRTVLLLAERVTAPVTDLVITMNRWDTDTAEKYRLGRRVAFVPGVGVDFEALAQDNAGDGGAALRRALGIDPEAFVLLYPAEFSTRKNQGLLLEAMAQAPQNVTLVLPGSGDLLDSCKARAHELGLEGRVIFPGYVDGMGAWYEMADCAVTSSRSEGLPFHVMEAMAYGLPVVASAVKGHEDLVEHEKTGLLYPYGDKAACAAHIARLAGDRDYAKTLGAEGLKRSAPYALELVLPLVTAEYESMM